MTMVKSGEIFFEELEKIENNLDDLGYLNGIKSRPRNICIPAPSACGIINWF